MLLFTQFDVAHLSHLQTPSVATHEIQTLTSPEAVAALATGPAISAWNAGECLGAAGVVNVWQGRGEAWSLLGPKAGAYMVPIVRRMVYVLDQSPYRRVDMTVLVDNVAGQRLAHLLGFELEARLEAYHMSGADMFMFKRIRKCP